MISEKQQYQTKLRQMCNLHYFTLLINISCYIDLLFKLMTTINITYIDKRVINKIYRRHKGRNQRLYGKRWKYICKHDRPKSVCGECNGVSICIHKTQRNLCKICKGSAICIHDKQRAGCKICRGSSICIHDIQSAGCKACNPYSHLYKIVSRRINQILGPGYNILELLDINIQEYRVYLTKLFKEGMTWENYGDWEIDHIIPFGPKNESTIEQKMERCHYTNTQPLWKIENRRKSKRHKRTDDSQTILKYIVKP
jgi:hypothetical protein